MYKATVENANRRTLNSALNDRKNMTKSDFDKLMSDLGFERQQLIEEKKVIEAWIAKMRYDLQKQNWGLQKKNLNSHNSRVKWEHDRDKKLDRVKAIEIRLSEIKREMRDVHTQSRENISFPDAFYRICKDALPSEIFDRMSSAAIAYLANHEKEN
ncbi:hypothetical protein [Rhizobium laguerreae]|uniref:Uncharacterized protein n=1 Tax=Rhizobium laguerreae TaxID=1076926 RepID=A0A7Y2RBA8_9HYPH|nr:hypothetical protein [Rhizobium laguerreae]NNH67830.1 hypothetical protein [Rhizobium laguerreae]